MVYSSASSKTIGEHLDDDHPPTKVINGICFACRFEVSRTFDGVEVHAPAPASTNRAMQFMARRPPASVEEESIYDVAETLQETPANYVPVAAVVEELRRRGSDLSVDVVNHIVEKEAHWGRMDASPAGVRVLHRPRPA